MAGTGVKVRGGLVVAAIVVLAAAVVVLAATVVVRAGAIVAVGAAVVGTGTTVGVEGGSVGATTAVAGSGVGLTGSGGIVMVGIAVACSVLAGVVTWGGKMAPCNGAVAASEQADSSKLNPKSIVISRKAFFNFKLRPRN